MDDPEYRDGNRAFLQAILAKGTITYEEARPILAEILSADGGSDNESGPGDVTEEVFRHYIDVAARAVSHFDFEIRSTVHQETAQRIYALVNTHSDPQTQLATTYNPEELSFIKRVLDAMFDKYNSPRMEVLAITEMQAIKLARPSRRQNHEDPEAQTQTTAVDRGLKHSEVESVLDSLVGGGWFEKSEEGFFRLSPRALLELRPWLIESFNDSDLGPDDWQRIKFCEACRDIVTVGLRCPEVDCNVRLHDICEDAFWRTVRGTKCPKCSTEWTRKRYIGERSVTTTEAYQRGRRKGGGWRRSTLADEVIQQEGGADDEEAEDGDDHEEE